MRFSVIDMPTCSRAEWLGKCSTLAIALFTFSIVAGGVARAAYGSQAVMSYPVSPSNPTIDDCRRLADAYHNLLQKVLHQNLDCMRQPARFGPVTSCQGEPEETAWAQCHTFVLQECALEAASDHEQKLCKANLQFHNESEPTSENRRARQIALGNQLYEQSQELVAGVKNPEVFLRSALGTKKDRDVVFTNGTLNADVGQELYRYAQNQAHAGARQTPNSLISAIQQASLDKLAEMHRSVLSELDKTLRTMASLGNERRRNSGRPGTPAEYQGPSTPISGACRIAGTCR